MLGLVTVEEMRDNAIVYHERNCGKEEEEKQKEEKHKLPQQREKDCLMIGWKLNFPSTLGPFV